MPARVNIEGYFIEESDQEVIITAVHEGMALFDIEYKGMLNEEYLRRLPEKAVFIHNKINKNSELEVITELVFKKNKDTVNKLVKKHLARDLLDKDEHKLLNRLIRLNILEGMRELTGKTSGPWGILRGVRPTKIVHRLIDAKFETHEICTILKNDYGLSHEKANLVTQVALYQRPFLLSSEQAKTAVSIYIGIPYCPTRCLYCSFPAYVLPDKETIKGFLAALRKDAESAAALIDQYGLNVQSVYIGGGTPTSLPEDELSSLLKLVKHLFIKTGKLEFTVEAGRPDSINDIKIQTMKELGVTRVSVNPQTMQQKTLKLIGRKHSVQDIINTFQKMRQSGIPVINMDLIAGLPCETEKDFINTMEKIALLKPDNFTLHTLSIKKGSRLKSDLSNNVEYLLPDTETTIKMLDIAKQYADELGLEPYYLYRQKYMTGNLENVGYARPRTACLYNIQIMEERQSIIGIGPAAGTKAVDSKTWKLTSCYNAKDVFAYINNLDKYIGQRKKLFSSLFDSQEE